MGRNEVKLNGKTYKLSSTTRAWMLYEEITGKVWGDVKGITDLLKYTYCLIKSNKENDFEFTFDEFVDETDKDDGFLETLLEAAKGK